jgi:hypothetical protein
VGYVSKLIKDDIPECLIEGLDEKEWSLRIIKLYTEGINLKKFDFIYDKYFSEKHAYKSWLKLYSN